jgi:hypothetical protein
LPVEITLEMYAEKPVVLPFFTGHIARGLLLHFIRLVDPSASGLLHELNVSKPNSTTVHGKIPSNGIKIMSGLCRRTGYIRGKIKEGM